MMNHSSDGSIAKLAHLTKPVLFSDVICDDLSERCASCQSLMKEQILHD